MSICFLERGYLLKTVNENARRAKQIDIMEKCFDCYAEYGLTGVGVKAVADACGCNVASLYQYFENLDDLIIKSTEYCMSKVEEDFMAKAPMDIEALWRFVDEIPYWTAKKHGKKYRLMYQVYTHPKYIEYGQKFFAGVDKRYTEYAKNLESKLGIPYEKLTPMIFIFIRACVHYAMFEDEFYLKAQMAVLKEALELFIMKYNPKYNPNVIS
ncbi:MAG: TetR/AcrR family transcriptional regulator [Acutalibacteraceae bacterium]